MSVIRTRDRSDQSSVNGFRLRESGVLKAWPSAAPTFVAASGSSATTNASVAWPTGTAVGDLGIAVIETNGNSSTPTLTGWAHLPGSPVVDVADATGSKLSVLYRFAPSGLASTLFTNPGDHQIYAIHVFNGVSRTAVISATTDIKTTASTSLTFPSYTVPAPNSLVVFIASHPSDTSTAQFSNLVNANLTSITERRDVSALDGSGGGFCLYTGIAANAGSIGTSTITVASSVTNACMVLALEPSIALAA